MCKDAAREHSWNIEAVSRNMTAETLIKPDENRFVIAPLRQDIKRNSTLGILRGQFNEAASDPSNGYRVVEEQRARIRWTDEIPLNARFREHGHLRLHPNAERIE